MKLQDEKRANASIILPFVGKTIFDAEGVFEVEDKEVAQKLLESVIGLHEYGKKSEKSQEAVVNKSAAEKEKEEAIDNLKAKKLAELKEIAESIGDEILPKSEWEGLKKKDLLELLIRKIA